MVCTIYLFGPTDHYPCGNSPWSIDLIHTSLQHSAIIEWQIRIDWRKHTPLVAMLKAFVQIDIRACRTTSRAPGSRVAFFRELRCSIDIFEATGLATKFDCFRIVRSRPSFQILDSQKSCCLAGLFRDLSEKLLLWN